MSTAKSEGPAFDSAQQYHEYAQKYLVYQTSIKRLISATISQGLSDPQNIIDLGCGTGVSTAWLLRAFPSALIHGIDKSPEMLAIAQGGIRDEHVSLTHGSAEEVFARNALSDIDAVFSNATYWYLKPNLVLPQIHRVLKPGGVFAFNIAEPAVDFGDGQYDDRFLQTMVEVLDDRGMVFHRSEENMAGRLRLSYKPPTRYNVSADLEKAGFRIVHYEVWKFQKSFEELADFYIMPGFGVKLFRELTDQTLKQSIIDEIIDRLRKQGVGAINFRWAEFVGRKS